MTGSPPGQILPADAARRVGRSRTIVDGASALLAVPTTLLGLVSGYLALLTAVAWRARRRGRARTATTDAAAHRFIVLVPAHDEEQLLPSTLRSLGDLDYPQDRYRVHVVADNCTDGTAAVARASGVEVHERAAPDEPGKGPALNWLLHRLWARDEPHDAVVVFDADTTVAPGFLRVMDARLAQGERIIQGYYAVRDPGRSWAVALRYAALAVRHYLRPLARTSVGSSAGLHGNGMVIAADVMRDRAWRAHLTEDIAFEAELLLHGERVTFAPDAVLEAEMPARLEHAASQNARWERGRLAVVRHDVPRLVRAALSGAPGQRLRCADAAVDHLIPPFSLLTLATGLAGTVALVLRALRRTGLTGLNLGVAACAAGVQVAYVASGLRMVGAPATVWLALLRAPGFVAWKLHASWSAARPHAAARWIRTRRNP